MNVIVIISDSLNRHFLDVYGQPIEIKVQTPNINRLADKGVVFDQHFSGSLPCMPARRELFTGIQEFLWRPWGPIEPFDDPLPRIARRHGYVTQLITDHFHYFQHGSHGFFEDFQGFEFIRGHEEDAWQTAPAGPDTVLGQQLKVNPQQRSTDYLNRLIYARNASRFREEKDFLAPRVFQCAEEWLNANYQQSPFLLVIDSFDVHEPFHVPQPYATLYTNEDPQDPAMIKWPIYGKVDQEGEAKLSSRQVAFVRSQYAAKITMMDQWLGKVFDRLDDLDLWQDTMVIFTTDHGHYLGEKGWMGKPFAPNYNILAHIPLIVWHPHSPLAGQHVEALTAAVDLYPTVLDAMGIDPPRCAHGHSLVPLIQGERAVVRPWALFGYFGGPLNITDGRFTYHRPADQQVPLNLYSTMFLNPTRWFLPVEIPQNVTSGRFLPYTDASVWKYPVAVDYPAHRELLFDLVQDPSQDTNLIDTAPDPRKSMSSLLNQALRHLNAPRELYQRFHADVQDSGNREGGDSLPYEH